MKIAFRKTKSFLMLMVLLMVLFVFTSPLIALAQNNNSSKDLFPCEGPDCRFEHLIMLAQGLTSRLFLYGMILSSIIFAYAGFLYLTSQDNPGKRSKANSILVNVAIGIAIMMVAWVAVKLIVTSLLNGNVWTPF